MCGDMSPSSTPLPVEPPAGQSHDRTTTKVLRLLTQCAEFDWRVARVGDVGAGRGRFSSLVARELQRRDRIPEEGVFPVDVEQVESDALSRLGADTG